MGHPNIPLMYTYSRSHRDKRKSSRLQSVTPNGEWNRIMTDDLQRESWCRALDRGFDMNVDVAAHFFLVILHVHTWDLQQVVKY